MITLPKQFLDTNPFDSKHKQGKHTQHIEYQACHDCNPSYTENNGNQTRSKQHR